MAKVIFYLLISIGFVTSLGLFYLSNSGLVSFRKPYIVQKSTQLRPQNKPLAFVNVNLVPMDSERILADQTVVIRDGLIESIGDSAEVDVPEEAQVINAKGQYLMPGLVDMHVHIKEENELLLFVAHGVTTVRDMWGTTGMQLRLGFPNQLQMRAQIKTGDLFGPTLYAAGPIMEGEPATSPLMPVFRTPEEAAESVAWQKEQDYDFIKVYDQLTQETYQAILRAGQKHNIAVVGHAPKQAGLAGVLSGGQLTIEHLTGYIDPDRAAFIIPEDKLDHYATLTREAGVWNCPTIGVYQKYVSADKLATLEAQPEMAYVSPRMKFFWKRILRPGAMQNTSYSGDYPARIADIYTRMTRALYQNGAGIILGTDADNPYLVPGASLLDELDYLVEAGLSPYEAIEAGTRNAAQALGRETEFGTISQGKQADFILLADNPLQDVTHVRQRLGVMLRGQWLPETELQELLQELIISYTPTLIDRLWPVGLIILFGGLLLRRLFGQEGRK